MAQDSNSSAYTPWGEPSASTPQTWWSGYLTVSSLLGHIAIMLTVVSALTLLNLALNPGTWWSLAILVLWFALVVIHALGLVSVNLLLDESVSGTVPPRVQAEPHGPQPPDRMETNEPQRETTDPPANSWKSGTSPQSQSWGNAEASEPDGESRSEPAREPDDEEFTPLNLNQDDDAKHERVPWRAATDIAWLRRRRDGSDSGTQANEEASS